MVQHIVNRACNKEHLASVRHLTCDSSAYNASCSWGTSATRMNYSVARHLTQNLLFSTDAPGMLCIRSSSTRQT